MNSRIRLRILEQSYRAGVGHIGSALSIADIIAVLFGAVLSGEGVERERFVLSKGHAALALYAALYEVGRIDAATLDTFCGEPSVLGAHPEHPLEGVDFSTGSLGHGLSIGVGAALAARLQGSPRRTFVLLSDAELNEGSVWEAAMFAAHHGLGSLVAIVDVNRQQAMGYTRDVIDLQPLDERWRAFGWNVHERDGHDVEALRATVESLDPESDRPHVLLASTTFGYGVSFMQNKIEWHYQPLSDEQFAAAVAEVEAMASAEEPLTPRR